MSTKKAVKKDEVDVSKFVTDAKEMLKDEHSKMQTAREMFVAMKGFKRKHVIEVFQKGCGLSKAGASTYYQTIKNKKKK